MEEKNLKVGDIVCLKSDERIRFTFGAVAFEGSIEKAKVFWFDLTTMELKDKNVPYAILKKVDE